MKKIAESERAPYIGFNLCNDCKFCFADCSAKEISFGVGKGNDNVIRCDAYIKKEVSL